MKRMVLLITCVLLLCGCTVKNSDKGKVSTLDNGISWGFDTPTDKFHVIYEYEDGKKIISQYKNITYQNNDEDGPLYNLEDALKENVITMEDLINKYKLVKNENTIKLYSNNGGSKYIAVCGNIIIGNSSDVINECNRQK